MHVLSLHLGWQVFAIRSAARVRPSAEVFASTHSAPARSSAEAFDLTGAKNISANTCQPSPAYSESATPNKHVVQFSIHCRRLPKASTPPKNPPTAC